MDNRRSALIFFGILATFKLFTLLLIFILVSSRSTVEFLLASHVLWGFAALLIVWAPLLFWLRLIRVRAKRKRLQQAEWLVEENRQSVRR